MTSVHRSCEKCPVPMAFPPVGTALYTGIFSGRSDMPEKYQRPHSHERVQAVERMKRDWAAQRQSLATVRRFNASLSARGYSWFWPKIAAALVSKHHWLVIVCNSCGTVVDLDLRVKPRDPEASIRVALRGVQCPRCNGHGRPRIIGLAQQPSV
jgi:hypothetical protein